LISTKSKVFLVVAPLVVLLDQITKALILSNYELGSRVPVIAGFFDIVHFRNTGAAFGMLAGSGDSFRVPFFYAMALVATVLLFAFFRSLDAKDKFMSLTIALVFGGLVGNIIDRIRFGNVVDFVSLHWKDSFADFSIMGKKFFFELEWPAFNVADSAITIAMFMLIYSAFTRKEYK